MNLLLKLCPKMGKSTLEFPEAEIIKEPTQPKNVFDKQLKGLLSVPKPKEKNE